MDLCVASTKNVVIHSVGGFASPKSSQKLD